MLRPLPPYCWSGSLSIPRCFLMYTSTGTISISLCCMTLGCILMWDTLRSLWVLCFIMHSRPEIRLLLKRSCLRPSWTIQRSSQLIPAFESTGIGPLAVRTEPPQMNILYGCLTSSHPSRPIQGFPMCHRN